MKRSTHSKFRNTAILFELLTRQVASDTICGVEASPALGIIRQFFSKDSELSKELTLYNTLLRERLTQTNRADYLINAVLKLRTKLNNNKLREQKYGLIREIKKHYDLNKFFRTPLSEYRLCASIYRLFEGATISHVAEVVNSRFTILEHLTRRSGVVAESGVSVEGYLNQDEDVRLLAYKLMLDKFNSKYDGLSAKQKSILREYINNVSNTPKLRDFVVAESALIKKQIEGLLPKIDDTVTSIKLREVVKLLDRYTKIRVVKEDHVLSLLLYHELIKELKNVKS